MSRITMTADEVAETRALVSPLAERYRSPETPEFLNEADVLAHDLPRRIRKTLREFRLFEPEGALLIVSGWPVDDRRIGPTPAHWKEHGPDNDTRQEELLLVLLSALLGDPIGWSTQQDGRVVHDLLPIRGHEHEQVGTGSEELITWHVEDAFHPYRGDYLGMMCLRNDDRVPTTFAPMAKVALTAGQRAVLSSPHFVIRPDNSHLPRNRGDADGRSPAETALVEKAYRKIEQMCASPERIPVFFGDPGAPYVRMDPYFMDPPEDPEARATFEELQRRVDAALEDCVLEPGDICFIDNYRVVHGRKPFRARFDVTDRWLRRLNVARDLRGSRAYRLTAESRVLH